MMPKVVLIPTDKEGGKDRHLLDQVISRLLSQVDEIVLVCNYTRHGFESITNTYPVTILSKVKTEDYQLASTLNVGLEYIAKKYSEGVYLIILGDDCIPSKTYVKDLQDVSERPMSVANGRVHRINITETHKIDKVSTPHSGDGINHIVTEVNHALHPTNHVNALIGFEWQPEDMDMRYDEHYDGYWGLEDSDFVLQLLERGYVVVPSNAHCWHVNTGIRPENHVPMSHEQRLENNPNWAYFKEKWNVKQ